MLSSSDLPACPACGSREVRSVSKLPKNTADAELVTFYACAGCGRDRTDAWTEIQPAKDEGLRPGHPNEDINEIGQSNQLAKDPPDPNGLGIAATVKNGGES